MRGAVVDNYSNYGGSNYSNSGGPNLGYGEPSGAQRGLKVLAILHTIGGVLMLGLLLMWSVKAQANAESKISQASLLITASLIIRYEVPSQDAQPYREGERLRR